MVQQVSSPSAASHSWTLINNTLPCDEGPLLSAACGCIFLQLFPAIAGPAADPASLRGDAGVGAGPAVASALLTFPIKAELKCCA